jgi:hypothetical protein
MTRRTPEADIQRAIVHTLRVVLPRDTIILALPARTSPQSTAPALPASRPFWPAGCPMGVCAGGNGWR